MRGGSLKTGRICVIPARGGSKRLPGKNLLPVGSRALVVRAVDCARAAGVFERIIVTTDDPRVEEAVHGLGCEVRRRSPGLASDEATLSRVLLVLLDELESEGIEGDLLCLLLPTSPLRLPEDVVDSLAVLERDPEAKGVLSVVEYEHTPQWAYRIQAGRVRFRWEEFAERPRSELEVLYRHDGSVMWIRASELREQGHYHFPMAPYSIPAERAVDVDTPLDLAFAEFLSQRADRDEP